MSSHASSSKAAAKEEESLPDLASLVVTGRAVDPDDPKLAQQKGIDLDFGDDGDDGEASPLALLPPFYVEMVELIERHGECNESLRELEASAAALDEMDPPPPELDEIAKELEASFTATQEQVRELTSMLEQLPECMWQLHEAATNYTALYERIGETQAEHMALFESQGEDGGDDEEALRRKEGRIVDRLTGLEEQLHEARERMLEFARDVEAWEQKLEAEAEAEEGE